jgi:hypothetical protein
MTGRGTQRWLLTVSPQLGGGASASFPSAEIFGERHAPARTRACSAEALTTPRVRPRNSGSHPIVNGDAVDRRPMDRHIAGSAEAIGATGRATFIPSARTEGRPNPAPE